MPGNSKVNLNLQAVENYIISEILSKSLISYGAVDGPIMNTFRF
jgi:hypothetical protein